MHLCYYFLDKLVKLVYIGIMLKERLYIICIIFLILTCSLSLSSAFEFGSDWNQHPSEHFLIYSHPSIPNKYITEFTKKCERYYRLITERLGFTRFSFWLWEDRAKIFIYRTRQDYLKSTGYPQWSGASVEIKKKIINTFYFDKGFFDTILPHELSHIILKEFVGFDTKLPLWFEEGVACANEKDSLRRYFLLAKGLTQGETLPTVRQLEKEKAGEISNPAAFYAASGSLAIFFLEEYGKEDFAGFCRQLRDGNGFYQAMNKVYGIKDAQALNERFLTFLQEKE